MKEERIKLICEYLQVGYNKSIVIRKQQYANAAELRDTERKLAIKINDTFENKAELKVVEKNDQRSYDYRPIESMIDNYIDSFLGYCIVKALTGVYNEEALLKRSKDFMIVYRDFKLNLILNENNSCQST